MHRGSHIASGSRKVDERGESAIRDKSLLNLIARHEKNNSMTCTSKSEFLIALEDHSVIRRCCTHALVRPTKELHGTNDQDNPSEQAMTS